MILGMSPVNIKVARAETFFPKPAQTEKPKSSREQISFEY